MQRIFVRSVDSPLPEPSNESPRRDVRVVFLALIITVTGERVRKCFLYILAKENRQGPLCSIQPPISSVRGSSCHFPEIKIERRALIPLTLHPRPSRCSSSLRRKSLEEVIQGQQRHQHHRRQHLLKLRPPMCQSRVSHSPCPFLHASLDAPLHYHWRLAHSEWL